jgi:hypothetical protein
MQTRQGGWLPSFVLYLDILQQGSPTLINAMGDQGAVRMLLDGQGSARDEKAKNAWPI